uniref:subunit 2 of NADH-plastoquinone oxidoreductase n=1 Tax=Hormidiella parvula TaxID=2058785 RepID=UPI00286BFC61|nr:subunit 2 of NADH-plastoquinone oxidoreductase [Hormidiella parvula]YP_010932399.1 subunit 2 of NADH-plastoquinone oxidoreductase [Hormidiella parvula]WKT05953.1 subunit 2 of NADH-plastoquinone oxidoreductase [Hormidiella parvula]WKT05954.1 subunit 2 of NADH-plastoquinone oxidoreductase [Hormidiella parvula]
MELADPISLLHATTLLPEGILTAALLSITILDLSAVQQTPRPSSSYPRVALAGLALATVLLLEQWYQAPVLSFLGSFQGDPLGVAFRLLIAVSSALCLCLSTDYVERAGGSTTEFVLFLLSATIGGMLLSGANDLVMVFVSLECLGLSSYLLSGHLKKDARSNEAAMKYLLIGGASSAILAYGLSWLYGLSGGEIELYQVGLKLASRAQPLQSDLGLGIAMLCVLVGIGFKTSAAPFHQWAPDVYEGSPTPGVAFLSVGSKAAGLALATRLLTHLCLDAGELSGEVSRLLCLLCLLSMLLGNLIAITQTSMKRMLAYSSISQAGYLLIGLIAGLINGGLPIPSADAGASASVPLGDQGIASLILYLGVYLFMNLGAFACSVLFALRTGTDQIRDYTGLYGRDPRLALSLGICLLSLGGLPPLAGFFGKVYLFWSGWEAGLHTLVLVGLFSSAVSIYYYLRVIKAMLVKEPSETSPYVDRMATLGAATQGMLGGPGAPRLALPEAVIGVCVLASSLAGIAVNPFISLAQHTLVRSLPLS